MVKKIQWWLFCFSFSLLIFGSVAIAGVLPQILVDYSWRIKPWYSYGNLRIVGEIPYSSWKFDQESKAWEGEIEHFSVTVTKKGREHFFKNYGLKFNENASVFLILIDPSLDVNKPQRVIAFDEIKKNNVPLRVSVYGYSDIPDSLIFQQEIDIRDIDEHVSKKIEVEPDNFELNGSHPDEINVSIQTIRRKIVPSIELVFKDSSEASASNSPTPTPQSKKSPSAIPIIPESTPQPEPSTIPIVPETTPQPKEPPHTDGEELSEFPTWIIALKKHSSLALEFIDQKGVANAFIEWDNFPEPKKIPDNIQGYDSVLMHTYFGVCRAEKILNKHVEIADFIRPLEVDVSEPNTKLTLSYFLDNNWNPLAIYFIDDPGTITIDMPMTIDQSTLWRLSSFHEGDRAYETIVEHDDEHITKEDILETYDVAISVRTLPEALITVKVNGIVSLLSQADDKGMFENILPLLLGDEITIIVEKEGYKTEKEYRRFDNHMEDSIPVEIELIKVEKLALTLIKKNFSILEKLGGDPDALTLHITDDKKNIVFKGLLKDAELLVDGAYTFRLFAYDYKFASEFVKDAHNESGFILIMPTPKERKLKAMIKLSTDGLPLANKENSKFFISDKEIADHEIAVSQDEYSINIWFYYLDSRKSAELKSQDMVACYKGFKSHKIKLTPTKDDSIKGIINAEGKNLTLLAPEVIIVISGNEFSTKDYWIEGSIAVADVWQENMRVFFSKQGQIFKMEDKVALLDYSPAPRANNFDVNSELQKATAYFGWNEVDLCGNFPKQHLVYIARKPGDISYNYGHISLHIISPDPAPLAAWKDRWHTCQTSDAIQVELTKILERNGQ